MNNKQRLWSLFIIALCSLVISAKFNTEFTLDVIYPVLSSIITASVMLALVLLLSLGAYIVYYLLGDDLNERRINN